ncbi:MAG: heme-binding domain-containing protein [Niastella sp.]|nr:heme-binding domain-containing protein [Niastella sp.]
MKKKTGIVSLILLAIFGMLQFFRPEKLSNSPAGDLAGIPPAVNDILRNACYDCHSSQTNLRWYDQLTPANYLVYSHIRDGRKVLNFSKWDSMATPAQNSALYYALNKIMEGEMPLPAYTMVHSGAKLKPADIEILKKYTFSRTPRGKTDTVQINMANKEYVDFIQGKLAPVTKVAPAPNGIDYIPDYRNWKVMSTTDRFDNGTLRIIFANDIAVKSIEQHQTKNWPDGAVFAKTAWKQQVNVDGSVSAGAFWQVEFMIKDARKYAETAGWGWARWRGDKLKPYGENALFATECVSCHQPMKDNDFVFTKPLNLLIPTLQNK